MQLPSWPCSQLPHAPLPDTRPTRSTTQAASLQLEGFKLQTSRKWISEQGLFFFFSSWREADKAIPLGSCSLGLLKTLGGLRPTQEADGRWFRSEPLTWEVWGLPKSPEECAPSPTHLTESPAQMPGTAPGTAPARNVCKSGGSAQGSQIAENGSKSQDKSRSHPVDNSFEFLPQIHPQQNC